MNYTNFETALNVREQLFSKQFPATNRRAIGSPCRFKTKGGPVMRALLVSREGDQNGPCMAMTDLKIQRGVGYEFIQHREGKFFIPMRFWMPYGIWTEEDGTKVLFSREYCPLWKIQEGHAPVQDDPDRWVDFIDQHWFFNEMVIEDRKRGLKILDGYQISSVPKLVEWLPKCLKERKNISKFKKGPP